MNRLYFIGKIGNGKYKHLAYIPDFEDVVCTLCLPNIPLMCSWDCSSKKEGEDFPAGRREAEQWDEYYAEVTCPTCLKRARGKDTEIKQLSLGGKAMKLTIYMEPVGKARARTVTTKKGVHVSFTPDKTAHAENIIREHAILLEKIFPPGQPLFIEATFYRSRPKSLKKSVQLPVSKPDIDNYFKLVTDALEKFLYDNDSQITTAHIRKRFVRPGERPRIELTIFEDKVFMLPESAR